MLSKASALGVCAASLCVALMFSLWDDNSVLAQVQDALKKVKTATYTMTQTVGDQPPQTWKVKLFGDSLCRVDQANGTYLVFDIAGKKMMEVNPSESKARFIENLSVPEDYNVLAMLMNLKKFTAKEQPEVPNREIDGVTAIGFVVEENGVTHNAWINPKTNLPLEMEADRIVPLPDGQGGVKDQRVKEHWTNFTFNEPLDEKLFLLQPPKGFAVDIQQARGAKAADEKDRATERLKAAKKAADSQRENRKKSPAASNRVKGSAANGSKDFIIAPPHSVGPVQLGMSPESVRQILGEPAEQHESTDHHQLTMDYRQLGLHLTFDTKELGLRAVICLSGKHDTMFFRESRPAHGFEGQTENGIGIGSPFSDVQATYGDPDVIGDYSLVPGVVEHTYFQKQLSFLLKDGEVIEIHLVRPQNARDFSRENRANEAAVLHHGRE